MSNIKNLEMAKAVFAKSYISINKSFFGLCQKVIYAPTGSRVKAICQEYSAEDGLRLEQLLSLPCEKMEAELASEGKPTPTAVNCSASTNLSIIRWASLVSSRERKQRQSQN